MESFCPAYTTQTEHLLWQEESKQTESTSRAHPLPEVDIAKVQTWPKNDAFIDERPHKAAKDSILNFYSNDNFSNICKICNSFICFFVHNKDCGASSDAASFADSSRRRARPAGIASAVNAGGPSTRSAEDILKFVYTNATSLNNKTLELTARLNTSPKPQVIMVTETWFNESSTPFIGGYSLYQKNRKEAHGGGVCIYVCESMMSVEVCDLSLCSKEVEVVWCEIKCGLDRVLVGCFYRNPRAPQSEGQEICRLIRNAKNQVERNKYTALMIAGDFNFPRVNRISGSGTFNSERMERCACQREFLELSTKRR